MFPDLLEIGVGAWQRYENVQQIAATAFEKKVMLDRFYNECNSRIASAGGDGGEWKLSFNGKNGKGATAIHNFNLWGIGGLMSEWTLKGELVRSVTGAGDGFIGNYEGILTLEIEAVDMAGSFDAGWFNRSSLVPADAKTFEYQMPNPQRTDVAQSTTVLKRIVKGSFLVYISGSGSGSFSPTMIGSMTSESDNTEFSFNHIVTDTYGTGNAQTMAIDNRHENNFTSNNPNTLTNNGSVVEGFWNMNYETYSTPYIYQISYQHSFTENLTINDIGTVWRPLESSPQLTIYMR
jgi:hypothetical protein